MIESCGNTLLDTLTNLLDFAKINSLLKHKPGTADEKKPQHVDVRLSMKQNVDLSVLVQDVVEGVYVGFVSSTSHDMDLASQNWTHSSNPSSSEISVSELPLVTVNIERRSSWVLDLDVGAWKRIVMNLAGNSIKYTPNGHIEVNLRTEGMRDETGAINAICFEVVDTGIGNFCLHKGL
jgi:signal transduction histidine kinase